MRRIGRIGRWLEVFSPGEVADMSDVSFVRPVVMALRGLFLVLALPILLAGPFVGLVWAWVSLVVCSPWLLYLIWWERRNARRFREVAKLARALFDMWAVSAHRFGEEQKAWETLPWRVQNRWLMVARRAIQCIDGKGDADRPRRPS